MQRGQWELSHQLHSSALDILGLVPALRGLTRDLGRTYGIKITFANSDGIPTVPPDVALCLFRVAQEALMNVAKHSRAKSTEVQLSSKNGPGTVQLTVTDDGEGFDPASLQTDSPGLISMLERLRMVGGQLEILSQQRKGTQVRVEVPLRDVSASHESPHNSAA